MDLYANRREAKPEDVRRALEAAPFTGWPQDEEDMLALINLLLAALDSDGGDGNPN